MFEFVEGQVNFKLIDFDNATLIDAAAPEKASAHHAGTLPSMAYELVEDAAACAEDNKRLPSVIHALRHDFTSVYYLSLYCEIGRAHV